MSTKIPPEFPKVWPYDPLYRGHVVKALSLKEDPLGIPHIIRGIGILFIILGLPLFIFPVKVFGYSFAIGCCICILSYPFVKYSNKKQQENFKKVMNEVTEQVNIEKKELDQKASKTVVLQNDEDQNNQNILDANAKKHYTPNWAWVRNKLLYRDNYSCCLCGCRVQLADSVAHHINAFSEGGKTEFSNLVTICVNCHSIIHPWLNPRLNLFWIRYERGRVYCWRCKRRLDTTKENVIICSDCGWLHHINDGACGCNYPRPY